MEVLQRMHIFYQEKVKYVCVGVFIVQESYGQTLETSVTIWTFVKTFILMMKTTVSENDSTTDVSLAFFCSMKKNSQKHAASCFVHHCLKVFT